MTKQRQIGLEVTAVEVTGVEVNSSGQVKYALDFHGVRPCNVNKRHIGLVWGTRPAELIGGCGKFAC